MAEEKEKKKKSKKGLIIAILLIIVIIAVAVAVVVVMNSSSDEEKAEEEKTTGVEWGDSYYVYLLEDFENDVNEVLSQYDCEDLEEIEISFVELEDFDYPVMIVEGLISNVSVFTVAYIEDDTAKSSEVLYTYEYSDVSYLYNIENEGYDWYVHTTDDDYDCYKTVSDYILGEDDSYVEFEKGETSDLENMVISDFDKTFVKADVKVEKTEVTLGDEEGILTGVTELAGSYKTSSELLTDDVTADVEEKAKEIQEVLEELSSIDWKTIYKDALENTDFINMFWNSEEAAYIEDVAGYSLFLTDLNGDEIPELFYEVSFQGAPYGDGTIEMRIVDGELKITFQSELYLLGIWKNTASNGYFARVSTTPQYESKGFHVIDLTNYTEFIVELSSYGSDYEYYKFDYTDVGALDNWNELSDYENNGESSSYASKYKGITEEQYNEYCDLYVADTDTEILAYYSEDKGLISETEYDDSMSSTEKDEKFAEAVKNYENLCKTLVD